MRRDPVLWLVALAIGAPFLIFRDVPLLDLPNHVARLHILYGEGAPGAGAYYAAHWRFIPNLGMEGWVFLFHRLFGVEGALHLFLGVTAAQLFLGAAALNCALWGRERGFALAGCLFVFGAPLLLGFLNECFGVGLALWGLALWLKRGADRRFAPLQALIACAMLTAHLFAFGVYALAIGASWAWQAARTRRAPALPLLHLAAPALLLLVMPHDARWDQFYYAAWPWKLEALRSAGGFTNPVFDGLMFWLAAMGGLALTLRLTYAAALVPALAALAMAYLALPFQLGEATLVDYRVPAVLALFVAAGLGWRNPADPWRRRADFAVLALFAIKLGVMSAQWAAWQPVYGEFRAAFARLPQGARLLPLGERTDRISPGEHPPLGQIAALAVTLRGAFIPTMFAGQAHLLLDYRPPYRHLMRESPSAADAADYDYVLLVHPERFDRAALPPFAPVAQGPSFVLGRFIR